MINLDEVIEGCRNGNRVMQKQLYEYYSPRFYALCRRYIADEEDANGVLVDGFIKIFEEIGRYRGEGSFEGWMQTIILRTAVRYFRDLSRRRRYFEPLEDADFDSGDADVASRIDIRDALTEAIGRLDADERLVFNLVAVEEYTFGEAGTELELSESTVKSRYYRALNSVRGYLKKRLGENFLKRYK